MTKLKRMQPTEVEEETVEEAVEEVIDTTSSENSLLEELETRHGRFNKCWRR